MNREAGRILHSARVPDHVAEQSFGPWEIKRHRIERTLAGAIAIFECGTDRFAALHQHTAETLMQDHGEVVMEDTPRELARHLPIWLEARGRVLVTGLGLGCVVRGLLHKPEVDHVDVVEIDAGILSAIGAEFSGNPRVNLVHGDALKVKWPRSARWDFAWHDLWCENGRLDMLHVKLMIRMRSRCQRQGAWGLDRSVKRVAAKYAGTIIGGRRARSEAGT